MKTSMPLFGIPAGIMTAIGYIPHILFLLFIILSHGKEAPLYFLLFTVGARILGDWLFWTESFPNRMDSTNAKKDWRLSVRDIIFSNSSKTNRVLSLVVLDFGVDLLLVNIALSSSISAALVCLVFSACHAIGSIIHGVLVYVFDRINVLLISGLVFAVVITLTILINGFEKYSENVLGFPTPIVMLFLLGAKGTFSGVTVAGKTWIAEKIKQETTATAS